MPTTTAHLPAARAENWWTTSGTDTFLTRSGQTYITSGTATLLSSPTGLGASATGASAIPSASFNSLSSTLPTAASSYHVSGTSAPGVPLVAAQQAAPVCIGHGVDAGAGGILAALIIPTAIGLLIWLLFAFLRPRFRQIYAVREWFVQPEHRPPPLSNKFLAFLKPPVPLVPSIPKDVSDAGRSAATDGALFPSDEQLAQRTLWRALLVVAGWSLLGLAGALPLYIVNQPCLARVAPAARFAGAYSTLQDLSLLRLLAQLDGDPNAPGAGADHAFLAVRAASSGSGGLPAARIRIIILAALLVVLGVLPALRHLLREHGRLAAFRRRWTAVRCAGRELGWLPVRAAPGLATCGERQVKEALAKAGLGAALEGAPGAGAGGRRARSQTELRAPQEPREEEPEVDVEALYTITDTRRLAMLIEERDEILEELEIAETHYIESFRMVTPDPSVADFFAPDEPAPDPSRPQISRPRPLTGSRPRTRHGSTGAGGGSTRRTRNPAYGASSYAPSSYMLPSQFYKLRRIDGVASPPPPGGSSAGAPSLAESIRSRVVGSRFVEDGAPGAASGPGRASVAWAALPPGSPPAGGPGGVMTPMSDPAPAYEAPEDAPFAPPEPIPDPARFGPNHPGVPEDEHEHGHGQGYVPGEEEEWDVVDREHAAQSGYYSARSDQSWAHVPGADARGRDSESAAPLMGWAAPAGAEAERGSHGFALVEAPAAEPEPESELLPGARRRPLIWDYPASHRSTLPMRGARYSALAPPPHLRLQAGGPYFRPLSGRAHADLGAAYAAIAAARGALKELNARIADAQADALADAADGARVRGWLLVGRGVRHIPGVRMVEGRAREDIRWHELQDAGGPWNEVVIAVIAVMTGIALAVGLLAAAGLALANAPDFAHYLPFLQPLANQNDWVSGVASGFAAAVGATVFIMMAVAVLHLTVRLSTAVSVSAWDLASVKLTFYMLTSVGFIWLTVAGAVLFALHAFDADTRRSATVANGAVYITGLFFTIIVNLAIIAPGLLLLQPLKLWITIRAQRSTVTPRQRFRALYPGSYNPTFAMGCCILAIVIAAAFSLIFPLIGPAVMILLILTLVAHRYLVGYVYARTHSQTGGLLQLWVLRRFATIVALQPLVLGLILLTRRLWPEGGALCGIALLTVALAEAYCARQVREPGRGALSGSTRAALDAFDRVARPAERRGDDDERKDLVTRASGSVLRARGSFASVLDMMSATLAVAPEGPKGPVPLQTETVDDLTATELAARTHPDAPPHLPPLAFDGGGGLAGLLYPPELVAGPPAIWLPHDRAGVAQNEARDLARYHGLRAVVDVRAHEDAQALGELNARASLDARRSKRGQ